MSDPGGLRAVRSWPGDRELDAAESLAATCGACGQPWRVHTSLAGFRLRCTCSAWVVVPAPVDAPAPLADREPAAPPRGTDGPLVGLRGELGDVVHERVPTNAPMAPGTLLRASASNQARWTNRTLLEFVAMLFALLGPQLAALWLSRGQEFELLLPFTSVVSGVLVATVVFCAGPYGMLGFARAEAHHYGEALLAAGVGLAAAIGWIAVLKSSLQGVEADAVQELTARLGVPLTLFVVALAPAVLEEVMFRGMLQGRLLALFGTRLGLLLTAVAFALCHGQPAVLPIHLGLGLYLGWLRERAGSLLPGMLAHFAYNGAIVVLGVG